MQQFPCPACQKMISAVVPPGTAVQCPLCQQAVQVPPASGPAAPPTHVPGAAPPYGAQGPYRPDQEKKRVWPIVVIGLSVMGVLGIALVAMILMPSLTRARELSKRTVCAANLRGLGQALYIYAQDEPDGAFPDDIQKVLAGGWTTPKQFICPSTTGGFQCYYYVPGQTTNSDPRGVLMFEAPDIHDGEGGNVLYQDGHVQFVRNPQFQTIVDGHIDMAQ